MVPLGAVGELYLGGDGLAIGYLGQPAQTADSFRPDPFSSTPGARMYRTGDHVRLVPAGYEFVGRRIDQRKVQRVPHRAGEIETVVRAHPDVRDCLVDVLTDTGGDARLVAYLGAPTDAEETRICASSWRGSRRPPTPLHAPRAAAHPAGACR